MIRRSLRCMALSLATFLASVHSAPAVPLSEARAEFEKLSIKQRIWVQILLVATGYSPDVPVEHLNKSFYDGIRSFQVDNNLPGTGIADEPQMKMMIVEAVPFFKMWGFRKVSFKNRPIEIWAPLGLGLEMTEKPAGLHFQDRDGRLVLDLVSKPDLGIATVHDWQIEDAKKHGAVVHYDAFKKGGDWFAISTTWADGSDHYYRYHQDGHSVTGFALEWNNEVENINAERIAVLMSASLRSAMTGAPFADPPEAQTATATPVVASVPPISAPIKPGGDPPNCIAVRDATARLACFDAEALSAGAQDAHSSAAQSADKTSLIRPAQPRALEPDVERGQDDFIVEKVRVSPNAEDFWTIRITSRANLHLSGVKINRGNCNIGVIGDFDMRFGQIKNINVSLCNPIEIEIYVDGKREVYDLSPEDHADGLAVKRYDFQYYTTFIVTNFSDKIYRINELIFNRGNCGGTGDVKIQNPPTLGFGQTYFIPAPQCRPIELRLITTDGDMMFSWDSP